LDFSKLKLDIYDLLGLILPGLLAIAEGWIVLRGWAAFILAMSRVSGTGLTLLLVFAFGLGQIIQEFGDVVIRFAKGKRYLRNSRDRFWISDEARLVKHAIKAELGHDIPSSDAAFDYCLTKLKGRFDKRDIFVATSDLCRSFVVLSVIGIVPACRISFHDIGPLDRSLKSLALLIALLVSAALLAWRRMVRYRALSEVTVFRAYLGVTKKSESLRDDMSSE
jgi:hypothetical protein